MRTGEVSLYILYSCDADGHAWGHAHMTYCYLSYVI